MMKSAKFQSGPWAFFPALLQIPCRPTDPNEILSLINWIKDCSNHGFIYIYIYKLEMINYVHGMIIRIYWNLLLFQSNKQIKELGAQTVEKPLRAKRRQIVIKSTQTLCMSETVRLSFCVARWILTDIMLILNSCSDWMPHAIPPLNCCLL